ncbi:MAG: UDP-N-acetylmuramoyl-L-alanyl-D-glutamate--2,6-diaminopimelate ligase [Candidatus Pelagibacter sp.]
MLLKDYYSNLNKKFIKFKFNGIAFDSNLVKKNYIFFAIKGNNIDGNKFIKDAIKNGSKIIVSEKVNEKIENNILYLNNKNPRKLLAEFSAKINYKRPNNLIAVTGTNGKSSIANFYYQILKLNKIKVASIGTLGVEGINYKKSILNTTYDPIHLNNILKILKKKKINNVILEASSHGLKQHRLDGLKFNLGIFTNLSRDHLDYHKTFKNYFDSKLILFRKLMKKKSNIIFDEDLIVTKKIKNIIKNNNLKSLSIGSNNSNLKIIDHKFINLDQHVKFLYKNNIYKFSTKLIGKIQIKNLLMSILAASKSNLNLKNVLNSIKTVKPVPGRFEKVSNLKNNSIVILDYAHTPDALKVCLKNIKDQFFLKKINIVFGCGGERDRPKRKIMGRIANKYCDKIYLTDDNPRRENPKKIRNEIKSSINKNKLIEISSREHAIKTAIKNIKSNEIVVVAGKGHESYQEYKKRKLFSDKDCIIKSIKVKNSNLNKNWKSNIVEEKLKNKLNKNTVINRACINSKEIKKNNIFFGIKGKKIDGNKFANEALKKGASVSIIEKNYGTKAKNKIKVKNTLKFFTECAHKVRVASDIIAIGITGSAGKTSLKELLGQSLNKINKTAYSKKSYNNKYGVPISLFNINKKDKYGVFEIGMDRKGEINYLSKIIKPNIGLITNITYAHSKNFKNLFGIAKAKSEIIDNILENGSIILNADDKFYNYFRTKALKRNLKIVSFSKKNKSDIKLEKIKRQENISIIKININGRSKNFILKRNAEAYADNILASLAVISNFLDLKILSNKFFFNYNLPEGRGDYKLVKINKKKIHLIDESYNSNPLSLDFALKNYNNLKSYSKKIILLGDMLELGKFSKKLHLQVAKIVNKTNINRAYVYGKRIAYAFNKIRPQKRGKILYSIKDVSNFLKNDIKDGEYLMVKGSNSTGLNTIMKNLKLGKINAI